MNLRASSAEKLEELLTEDNMDQDESSMDEDNAGANLLFHSEPKKAKTTLANIKEKIMKKAIFAQQNSPKMEVNKFLDEYSNSPVMKEDGDVFDFWKGMSQSTKELQLS